MRHGRRILTNGYALVRGCRTGNARSQAAVVLRAGQHLMRIKAWWWSPRSISSHANRTNMKPFSNHRTRRHTTFVAILVWAFALASGMAKACLLETTGQRPAATASHSSDAHHTHISGALAGDAIAVDHDDDADASRESCLKACDDGSNGPIKLQTWLDRTDPGLTPFVVFAWIATTPIAPEPSRFDELQVPVVGPPFRLRYPRLTL